MNGGISLKMNLVLYGGGNLFFDVNLMVFLGLEYLYIGCILGIIYCDVKIGNILLIGKVDVVKIVDFGFLKLIGDDGVIYVLMMVKGIVGYFDLEYV